LLFGERGIPVGMKRRRRREEEAGIYMHRGRARSMFEM